MRRILVARAGLARLVGCHLAYSEIEREHAEREADVAKALGDPVRMQLVHVLRKHAGKVCVCELVPPFDLSQPTVSDHLKSSAMPGSSPRSARA